MGLRIRERDKARKIRYARSRALLTEDPVKRVREMCWQNDHADEDFLEKLASIRNILKSDQRAFDIADSIDQKPNFEHSGPLVHNSNLLRTILKLL